MVSRAATSREFRQDGSIEEATQRLQAHGFIGSFSVVGPERMRCDACREESDANKVRLLDVARVDVTTDPDDQSVVAGLECPHCEARGTYVFSYGPTASAEDKASFAALENRLNARRA